MVETPVGDRNVLEALEAERARPRRRAVGPHRLPATWPPPATDSHRRCCSPTWSCRSGRPLAELADGLVERVPQVLVNVPVADPGRLADAPDVWVAVAEVEAELGGTGRVVLRASGTEPVVRVMVEATARDQAHGRRPRLTLGRGRWRLREPAPDERRPAAGSLWPDVRDHRRHRCRRCRSTVLLDGPASPRVPRVRLRRRGPRQDGGASGGRARPTEPTRWPTSSRGGRGRPGPERERHRPHALGHPRPPDRATTPTHISTAPAGSPSSTTASSRTTRELARRSARRGARARVGDRHRGARPPDRGAHGGGRVAAPRPCARRWRGVRGLVRGRRGRTPTSPTSIVAARRAAPLVVGLTDAGSAAASSARTSPRLLGRTRRLFAARRRPAGRAAARVARVSPTSTGRGRADRAEVIDWDLEPPRRAASTTS